MAEQRCKQCKAPLYSSFEKEQGLCGRCLKERNESSTVSEKIDKIKAEVPLVQTPSEHTKGLPKSAPKREIGIPGVYFKSKGDSANILTKAYKISPSLSSKMEERVESLKTSNSAYIRALIAKDLGLPIK